MGLTSAQLDVVDLTPGIGSEIRTDIDTLLSGAEAERIRAILEQRGVVFFRGLEISDEQQVAIAKTSATSSRTRVRTASTRSRSTRTSISVPST